MKRGCPKSIWAAFLLKKGYKSKTCNLCCPLKLL
jgi:hypothetical protein